jgi:hypothetical protein
MFAGVRSAWEICQPWPGSTCALMDLTRASVIDTVVKFGDKCKGLACGRW